MTDRKSPTISHDETDAAQRSQEASIADETAAYEVADETAAPQTVGGDSASTGGGTRTSEIER